MSDNKTTKKVIKIEKQDNKKPSDPNKKIVRRVVKVIDEKDLDKVDINKEINAQKEKQRQKELEEQRKELERIEREKRAREAYLRKKKEEEEQRKREQELRLKKLREAEKKKKRQKKEKERMRRQREAIIRKQEKARERAKRKEEKKARKEMAKQQANSNGIKPPSNNNKNGNQFYGKPKFSALRIIKTTIISLFFLGIAGCCIVAMIFASWCKDLPEIDISELNQSALTSYIYDTNGDLITTYSSSENREWVKLEDMPETLVNAFVSVEDKRFYSHGAIDPKRLVKAIIGQITGNDSSGGSTITQQLVKNVYLTNEVTYKRKVQEIVLAYRLEKLMSKDDILEAYLNIIYFGSSNYGVSAAAKDYFGKELSDLSLREIAMLAGIPKNPNGYNPRRNTYVKNDMSATDKRTDDVLWVMKENGVISESQYNIAINDTVEVKEDSSFFEMYKYAHAVEYAMQDVIKDILEQRGLENTYANRVAIDNEIRRGGYSIYTTIDPDIQDSVQNTVENWEDYPNVLDVNGDPIESDGEYEKPEVASVVIDPETGYILAMVGSRETVTSMKTFNRATSNNMPVASTIKPLSIYAPCLEYGLNPGSVEYNYQTYIEGYDKNTAYPGGRSPESPVTMREAVAQSYNVAAVRFLCNNIGYDLSEDYLIQLGISKDSIQEGGAGLALGTSGINMLELTAAYQSFANGGWYYEPKAYSKVLDNDENTVLSATDYQTKRRVFSEETAWLMTDMLANTVENGTAYKALIKGVESAGKTGTHQDKCAVFAGYTGEYVSSIWVGSDSFSSLSEASGGTVAAPIWQEYMTKIYDKKGIYKEKIYEEKPETIKEVTLCSLSGKLATDKCQETFTDYTVSDVEECDLHVTVNICNFSGMLQGNECPESAITQKDVLFVPLGSNLASIPEDIILEHYPNALIETVDSVCVSHVNGVNIPSAEQIGYSENLLTTLDDLRNNTLLEQQYIDLANYDYSSISDYIDRAKSALYNGAQESETFYTDYFTEYNRVKTDISNLQAIINNIVTTQQAQQAAIE